MKPLRGILVMLIICISLAVSLPMQMASATSAYDEAFSVRSSLRLTGNDTNQCNYDENHALDWAGFISDPGFWSFGGEDIKQANAYASFQAAVASGHNWGVLSHEYSPGIAYIKIFWSSSDMSIDWDQPDDYIWVTKNPSGSDIQVADVQVAEAFGCTPKVWQFVSNVAQVNITGTDLLFLNLEEENYNYPDGYEGDLIPSEYTPPSSKYVAMGDSFSSGEGNSLFEYGTDEDGVNECHRSESAYPHWLAQTPSLDLENMAFVACSGATTANVLSGGSGAGSWNSPSQVDALSEDTEVVTITIGGNDIGFREFASSCVVDVCDTTSDIYADTVLKISADLPDKLDDVFTAIANKTEDAHVYIIGYPQLIPDTGLDDLPTQCDYLDSSTPGDGLDAVAAAQVVNTLNTQLGTSVAAFDNTTNDTEFTFVDPNGSVDGTFEGHDLCSSATMTYFHNITPNDLLGNGYRPKIFHPNVNGQYEYYQIVEGAIEN